MQFTTTPIIVITCVSECILETGSIYISVLTFTAKVLKIENIDKPSHPKTPAERSTES